MMPDYKANLQQETKSAILAYNMNRAQLVQTASREGGPQAVTKLEDEFTALCNADFALTQATLNESHRQYRGLMEEAAACGELLKQSIIELRATASVLDLMAKTVMRVGRVLLMLTA